MPSGLEPMRGGASVSAGSSDRSSGDDSIMHNGKRRVAKKSTDRVQYTDENVDNYLQSIATKKDPASIEIEKNKKILSDLLEQISVSFKHEDRYNLPISYLQHARVQLNECYLKSFDSIMYIADKWELGRVVTIHGLNLFHRFMSLCYLSCPTNLPDEVFKQELWVRVLNFIFVCLVIAQKFYYRKSKFTFKNILEWLKQPNNYTLADFSRTEIKILDALEWCVTMPDIINYYEELEKTKMFNSDQMTLLYSLIEIGMYYPKCQIFKQRDIFKATIFLVLSKSCRGKELLEFYKLLEKDSPNLKDCISILIEKWNFTYHSQLFLAFLYMDLFGKYGEFNTDMLTKDI